MNSLQIDSLDVQGETSFIISHTVNTVKSPLFSKVPFRAFRLLLAFIPPAAPVPVPVKHISENDEQPMNLYSRKFCYSALATTLFGTSYDSALIPVYQTNKFRHVTSLSDILQMLWKTQIT